MPARFEPPRSGGAVRLFAQIMMRIAAEASHKKNDLGCCSLPQNAPDILKPTGQTGDAGLGSVSCLRRPELSVGDRVRQMRNHPDQFMRQCQTRIQGRHTIDTSGNLGGPRRGIFAHRCRQAFGALLYRHVFRLCRGFRLADRVG